MRLELVGWTSFRRESDQPPLTPRREGQAGADVFAGQVWEILENLICRHAGSEAVENIRDRDPQPADARSTPALAGLEGDDVLVVHGVKLGTAEGRVKASVAVGGRCS